MNVINPIPRAIPLIEPTTAAVGTDVPIQVQQRFTRATVLADALAGLETVKITASVDGGLTFFPLILSGAQIELNANNNFLEIPFPIVLGVTKDATASACGVYFMANQLPN